MLNAIGRHRMCANSLGGGTGANAACQLLRHGLHHAFKFGTQSVQCDQCSIDAQAGQQLVQHPRAAGVQSGHARGVHAQRCGGASGHGVARLDGSDSLVGCHCRRADLSCLFAGEQMARQIARILGATVAYLRLTTGEAYMQTRIGSLLLTTTLATVLTVNATGCGQKVDNAGLPPASTTIGTEIDDSVVTSSVKAALLSDPDVKSFDFKVETRKGEVMLSGFVDNQAQLDRATGAAHAVSGVKGVQNNVTLKGSPATVGNKVDDSIITGKVRAALLGDTRIKSLDIAVVTRKDEVQLSGFVDNQSQMNRALEVAAGIDGVRVVTNQMSIKK